MNPQKIAFVAFWILYIPGCIQIQSPLGQKILFSPQPSPIIIPSPTQTKIPSSNRDLSEQGYQEISAIINDDFQKEALAQKITIAIGEIIPSSSGNTRVLIQIMTEVKKTDQTYQCGYTVWFYQKNDIWRHERYRTDDSRCELSTRFSSF